MSLHQKPFKLKCTGLLTTFFLICVNDASGYLFDQPGPSSSELDSGCEMRPLQDSICCLESTFNRSGEFERLLHSLLQNVPGPKYEMYGEAQYLEKAGNSQEVGIKFLCDIPLGAEAVPGLGCVKCLQHIADEITSGMPSQNGRCQGSSAMRFGYIYEPDTPWGEDTTWCHLDYWLKPSPPPQNEDNYSAFSLKLNFTWRWTPLRILEFGRSVFYHRLPHLL
ncbi:hypothetical protein R1flu_012126 [Riccia fluitans]|uniref:Gnk2-homologous domain-containing protein n=1 Tax=Riccia fluitans TaxID=41844 RepID=A0ABD1ZC66_9MARC